MALNVTVVNNDPINPYSYTLEFDYARIEITDEVSFTGNKSLQGETFFKLRGKRVNNNGD